MKVTYDKGRQVAPVNPDIEEVKLMLTDLLRRQVRIETRLCVLTTALGYNAKLETRSPPYDTQGL